MLKVAIVGCGKIADAHMEQLRRIRGCQVVAVSDREILMASQLAERFGVSRYFDHVGEMLSEVSPDVVHVTTPPESHFEIGKLCLEAGCHIYVEKPFTIDTDGAEKLLGIAERLGRKVTVGHDLQFSPVARRMRKLVREGYLGSRALHMESYYSYDLSEPRYARALLANQQHWVRRLPGKLLQNIISHGVARIAEFFTNCPSRVMALGFTSPLLQSMGEREITDELRVVMCDENGASAYFTFSSQMRPSLNSFRIYGSRNGLVLDEDQQTLIKCPGSRLKSYAERFVSPAGLAGQYLGNLAINARKFAANDFHMKGGMKYLIESFYRSLTEDAPLPIAYREILMVSRIMDVIFAQLNTAAWGLPLPAKGAELTAVDSAGAAAARFGVDRKTLESIQ